MLVVSNVRNMFLVRIGAGGGPVTSLLPLLLSGSTSPPLGTHIAVPGVVEVDMARSFPLGRKISGVVDRGNPHLIYRFERRVPPSTRNLKILPGVLPPALPYMICDRFPLILGVGSVIYVGSVLRFCRTLLKYFFCVDSRFLEE